MPNSCRAFVAENREQFKPSVDKLNGVLTIVANRKGRLQDAIKRLNCLRDVARRVGVLGAVLQRLLANLLPGQFLQPFIDAAFSDLGLDPNVLLPSQLTDPQTGQVATPRRCRSRTHEQDRAANPDSPCPTPSPANLVIPATRIGSRRRPRRPAVRRPARRCRAQSRSGPPRPRCIQSDPLPDSGQVTP